MQMVVVPAMSTSATTEMAKVSFTVLPKGKAAKRPIQGLTVNDEAHSVLCRTQGKRVVSSTCS
jgi:hypothetical protein